MNIKRRHAAHVIRNPNQLDAEVAIAKAVYIYLENEYMKVMYCVYRDLGE
jgi:hypothetical protein